MADGGLTAAEALTIFGDRGGPAILALTGQVERLRALNDAMYAAGGAGKEIADIMRDNLGNAILTFRSAVAEAILSLGDAGLTGYLRSATEAGTEFFRAVGRNTDRVIAYLEAAALAVGALATKFIVAKAASLGFVGSLVALRGALLALGIPAIIIGVGELIHQFKSIYAETGNATAAFRVMAGITGVVFQQMGVIVRAFGESIGDYVKLGVALAVNEFAAFGQQIGRYLKALDMVT